MTFFGNRCVHKHGCYWLSSSNGCVCLASAIGSTYLEFVPLLFGSDSDSDSSDKSPMLAEALFSSSLLVLMK